MISALSPYIYIYNNTGVRKSEMDPSLILSRSNRINIQCMTFSMHCKIQKWLNLYLIASKNSNASHKSPNQSLMYSLQTLLPLYLAMCWGHVLESHLNFPMRIMCSKFGRDQNSYISTVRIHNILNAIKRIWQNVF